MVNGQGNSPANIPPRKWHFTHSAEGYVRQMPSLLLVIDCCIHHERLNELNYTMLKKWINLGFSYTQFVTPWISVELFFDKCSTDWKISRWRSDILTKLFVFTLMFRLCFFSCFGIHITERIHRILTLKVPLFRHYLQYIFILLKHTFHSNPLALT